MIPHVFFRYIAVAFSCAAPISLLSCASKELAPDANPSAHRPSMEETTIVTTQDFTEDTLFSLLAAEIGFVRGQYNLGFDNYAQQAFNTRDVNIVARATQIARVIRRRPEALELAELWTELDQGSLPALQILLSENIEAEHYDQALKVAKKILHAGERAAFDDIAIKVVETFERSLNTQLDQKQDTSALIEELSQRQEITHIRELSAEFEQLLTDFPDNAELLLGQSVFMHALGRITTDHDAQLRIFEEALDLAKLGRDIQAQNPRILYQQYRILDTLGRKKEAIEAYSQLVTADPANALTRARYARMLVDHDILEALKQFKLLAEASPDDADIRLSIALIELDQKRYDDAESSFKQLLLGDKHTSMANFGLAEIALTSSQEEQALAYYKKVDSGRRHPEAVEKAARIIRKLSGLIPAIEHLRTKREASDNGNEQAHFFDLAAKLYSESGDINAAFETLNTGLNAAPNNITLVFSRAMLSVQENDIDQAILDLNRALELAPESPTVLNAYGYTLLNEAGKAREAEPFIRKAHKLEPENAAILDSLGWLEYKLGQIKLATDILERAFASFADAEIAAHLGEVLWIKGKKRHARKTWKKGLRNNPTNKTLIDTITSFSPDMLSSKEVSAK